MFKFYQKLIIQQSKGISRIPSLVCYNGFASSTAAEVNNVNSQSFSEEENRPQLKHSKTHNMVRAAFASIHLEDNNWEIRTPATDDKIKNAKSINDLLSISDGTGVSRRHALKVVSVLSDWTSSAKVKLSDFETDPRFIRLCKILTKNPMGLKNNGPRTASSSKSDDLSTILSVAADDEAAKLVGSITLPQMVKVLSTLSTKKRRSTLLLRTLAYNIAANPENLDVKQCADLLYSISTLNFYDENLFERVANNVIMILQNENVKKSAVIGSILTSVGLLKYKNPALLDSISDWVLKNHSICRPQDIFSLFMTLAVLNYLPGNAENLFKVLVPLLTQEEAGKPSVWLDVVWSLILLNQANADHLKSVLNESFIDSLEDDCTLTPSVRLKLLNIDGAAHYLLENYDGPKIAPDHEIRRTMFSMSKSKSEMVSSVIDALKNLISESYLRTRINTGLGFYIDAECILDKTCNPQPVTTAPSDNSTRVAIVAYDYHDICKGRTDVIGVNALSQRLLAAMGYKIVSVPYTEYRPRDKIVHRVKYLETKLKEAVKS